jgi:hypothetical protein
MTRALAAAILVLAATSTRAAGDHELRAAEQELRIAKDHLEAAARDYQGHRRAASDLVDRALHEIRAALETSGTAGRQSHRPHESEAQPDDD